MARETEPLLARRPSSHASEEAAQEDALLTGHSQSQSNSFLSRFSDSQWRRFREALAFIWAFLATIGIIILAVILQHRSVHPPPGHHHHAPDDRPLGKRNLIFMVSDGMGPSSLSLTRSFLQYTTNGPINTTLALDSLLIGQSRTRSSSSLVTDSAAGATAFSCGEKSYNGAISMLPDGTPCASVMEAAKRAGYRTGVVVTTRVTDATPACFGAHVRHREEEDGIAVQMTGLDSLLGPGEERPMDLILGGGRCHFLPMGDRWSCRTDGRDVLEELRKDWRYVDTREGFDGLDGGREVKLPLLGLFAGADIPFNIDRRYENGTYPSLAEMARTAITALKEATKDSGQGFFLMIEGSRIDHAGHINDPAAQVHEVLAYDEAVEEVLRFVEEEETDTLMVATSDHETGGLALARQLHETYPDYLWKPEVLANATRSAEFVARKFQARIEGSRANIAEDDEELATTSVKDYTKILVHRHLGFYPTPVEIDALLQKPVYAVWILADMISRRAQIGWSSHGHTAADVNIFSSASVRSSVREGTKWEATVLEKLASNRENTDVGGFLRWWLDVEDEFAEVGEDLKDAYSHKTISRVAEDGRDQKSHALLQGGGDVAAYEAWASKRVWQ